MRTTIALLTATLMLTACGSTADSADVTELADTLTSASSPLGIPVTNKQANCLARAYLDSGLSDQAIDALKNGKPLAPATKKDTQAIEKIGSTIPDCLT